MVRVKKDFSIIVYSQTHLHLNVAMYVCREGKRKVQLLYRRNLSFICIVLVININTKYVGYIHI